MKDWIRGNTPPPTTIIMKIPDAAAVYLPNPSVARLKIEDHITDVHKPQRTSRSAATGTVVIWNDSPVNTGISIVVDLPKTIAATTRIIPTHDVVTIIVLLDTRFAMKPAVKRPTSIKNQYVAATVPAIEAALPKIPPPFSVVSER